MKTHIHKNSRTKIFSAIVFLVVLAAVAAVAIRLHSRNTYALSMAKTANEASLDSLGLAQYNELEGSIGRPSCSRSGLHLHSLCSLTESRFYEVAESPTAFMQHMTQALQIHGWYSSYNIALTNGYFSVNATHHYAIDITADVSRLAGGDNAQQPVQSNVQMRLIDKPPLDSMEGFSPSPNVQKKLQTAVDAGHLILMVSSRTAYKQ